MNHNGNGSHPNYATMTSTPTTSLPLSSTSTNTNTNNQPSFLREDSDNGKNKQFTSKPKSRICPPPTFNHNGTTRPYYLFPLFVLLNMATMADRAIIPGASKEFSAFLSEASDAPDIVRQNPDAGLGILQAGFIGGYSVAIVLSSHYVHKLKWKTLVLLGLSVWWTAVLGSGAALSWNSYYVLLVARMASGVSEAAFHVVAPPLIQDRSGRDVGMWMSVYLCGMPVGLAVGYVYGSFMASHERWGWNYAYYFECIFVLPLLITMGFVKDNINGGVLTGAGEYEATNITSSDTSSNNGLDLAEVSSLALTELDTLEPLLSSAEHVSSPTTSPTTRSKKTKKFTIWSEIKTCFSSPLLVTLSLGYAAMIAVVASLGTFGGAFVLALNLFDDERVAAACFGSAAALSGVVGMPLGGRLVDRVLSRYGGKNNRELGSMSPGGISGDKIDDSMRHSVVGGIMPRINLLVFGSLLFITPTLVIHDAVYFLTFLSIGWILLFATQTGIMLCAMLSVDTGHRPNALAFITLISHLLGDVPAPIVLGLIKDQLAPNCRVGADGEFIDPAQCSDEERGVRLTLAIAYAWTIWSLFFFELARRFAVKEMKKDDADRLAAHAAATSNKAVENSLLLREDEHIGDKGNLEYYHDKFKPHATQEAR